MSRWAILRPIDFGADGDPYLDRLRLLETPLLGIYLHHIHRPDTDRDPHDHPWGFFSLVLTGWYTEHVWLDKRNPAMFPIRYVTRQRERWSLRFLARRSAHMITEIGGPLSTLVLVGPKRRKHGDWGFWREGKFIPWREYISNPGQANYVKAWDRTEVQR